MACKDRLCSGCSRIFPTQSRFYPVTAATVSLHPVTTAVMNTVCDLQVIEKMKTAGGASNNGLQSKKVRKTDAAEPACHDQSCKEGLKGRAAGLSNPQPKSVQRAKVTLSAHQHMYVAILWCLTNVCLV